MAIWSFKFIKNLFFAWNIICFYKIWLWGLSLHLIKFAFKVLDQIDTLFLIIRLLVIMKIGRWLERMEHWSWMTINIFMKLLVWMVLCKCTVALPYCLESFSLWIFIVLINILIVLVLLVLKSHLFLIDFCYLQCLVKIKLLWLYWIIISNLHLWIIKFIKISHLSIIHSVKLLILR